MIMIHKSEKLNVNSLNNYMCNIFVCANRCVYGCDRKLRCLVLSVR